MKTLATIPAAFAILAVGVVLLVGPVHLKETHHAHKGSPAYWYRSVSYLKGHHHARVCDNMPNGRNAYVVVSVRGSDIKKHDRNGVRAGCGDAYFDRYGNGHRTGEGGALGGWSIH